MKFLEENTGQCFHELGIDIDCLHRMQKTLTLKEMIVNLCYLKIKTIAL